MSKSALGPMTVISLDNEPKSPEEAKIRYLWWAAMAALVGMLVFLAWLVNTAGLYQSGDDFGYNLGLVGGLLMLALLIYPLRKRWAPMVNFGKMESWFKFHMIAGILGPVLVLFHSTFRTGSMNAAMALYAMLLVAISGVVGRFIYRHIHRGMYGKQLTLAEAMEDIDTCAGNLGSVFALRTDIETRLNDFRVAAFDTGGTRLQRFWKFVTLDWKSKRLATVVRRDAKRVLIKRWNKEGGPRREMVLNYRLARNHISQYLESVVKASQLEVWEMLFSYWHVVHVPFLYLLLLSGVVHVVAVHMY